MNDFMMEGEIQEALTAGENALQSLYAASEQLDSARNWGIIDLLGGGFFTDLIKHSKMGKAEKYLSQARYYLQQFQKELRNVAADDTIQLQTGDFLSFADFFFDGFFTDAMALSRIDRIKNQVEDVAYQVQKHLNTVSRRLNSVTATLQQKSQEAQDLILHGNAT